MQAGKLRQRVALEQATETRDGFGSTLQSWSTLATVWAEVLPKASGSQESFVDAGAAERTAQVYMITIRYRSDVTTKMRAVWEGKTLDIERVYDPTGRRRTLVLEGTERR